MTMAQVQGANEPGGIAVAVRRRCLAVLFATAIALGLWVSLHYAFALWGPESDTAEPYVLWNGVLHHGTAFLQTFRYTSDNWLLSSLPAFFLAFTIIGDEPWVATALGWAIFAGAVLLAALVVRRAAGAAAAAAAAVVLLLSNIGAVGGIGLLAYPVSHNASLLWGMLALYAAMRWCEEASWPWLALTVAALVVAGVSDPWTEAAFTVPIGCAAVWPIAGASGRRSRAAALALAVVAALAADHTKLFGLLDFVLSAPHAFASGADRALAIDRLGRFAATFFNALPGRDPAYHWNPGFGEVANVLALVLAGAAVLALGVRQFGQAVAFDLLLLAGAASCGVITVAYVVLDTPKVVETGRYFMAAYFFAVMLFAAAVGRAWRWLPSAGRLAAASYGLLLSLAGLASWPEAWTTPNLRAADEHGVRPLAAFLEAHGLRYGYGTYWGAEANAVTWVTRGAVVVRPVTLDPATGHVAPRSIQTSPLWYTPEDVPPGQQAAFLAITPGAAEDEGCPDVLACAKAAEQQFGPARERLRYRDATVLVWDYPLFGASPEIMSAHVAPVAAGEAIDLTSSADSTPMLGEGWSHPEPIGTWTDAGKAQVLLHLPPGWAGPARITAEAMAFVPPGAEVQEVIVSFAGRELARWRVAPGRHEAYTATVPGELLGTGSGVLVLQIPGAVSPLSAKLSKDSRMLGINVRAIRVDRDALATR